MAASRLALWATLSGVVVGSVVAVGLVVAGPLDVPTKRDLTDAREEFISAWERSRTATVVVQSDFSRRQADGQTLRSRTELVQRPPDRLSRSFGGVTGVVDGHPIVCSTDPTTGFRCFPGTAEAPPYAETVAKEVANLRTYFEPPQPNAKPLYRALRGLDPGCFELHQQFPFPDAEYGTYAQFCFDERTGARTLLERHLENRTVEIERATSIETRVTDGDFDTSSNEGFDQSMDTLPGEAGPGTTASPATTPPGSTAPPSSTSTTNPASTPTTTTVPAAATDAAEPTVGGSSGAAPPASSPSTVVTGVTPTGT